MKIIHALTAPSSFTSTLNCWEKQCGQNQQDEDHDQELDPCESAAIHFRLHGRSQAVESNPAARPFSRGWSGSQPYERPPYVLAVAPWPFAVSIQGTAQIPAKIYAKGGGRCRVPSLTLAVCLDVARFLVGSVDDLGVTPGQGAAEFHPGSARALDVATRSPQDLLDFLSVPGHARRLALPRPPVRVVRATLLNMSTILSLRLGGVWQQREVSLPSTSQQVEW